MVSGFVYSQVEKSSKAQSILLHKVKSPECTNNGGRLYITELVRLEFTSHVKLDISTRKKVYQEGGAFL